MAATKSFAEVTSPKKNSGDPKCGKVYRTISHSLQNNTASDILVLLLKLYFFSVIHVLRIVLFFITCRVTPKNDFIESPPLQSSCSRIPDVSQSASISLLVYSASDTRRELDSGNSSNL